ASDGDLAHGVRAARAYLERFPSHASAIQAELDVAEAYAWRNRFEEAAEAFRRVVKRGSQPPANDGPPLSDAGRRALARAKVRLGDVLASQRRHQEAIEVWRGYLRDHPADPDWERAQRAVLDTELAIAADAYVAKRWADARTAW